MQTYGYPLLHRAFLATRIVSYLRTGSFPSKNKKDFLRRKMKNSVIKDGLLFYSDKKKAAGFQVLKVKACEFPLCLA